MSDHRTGILVTLKPLHRGRSKDFSPGVGHGHRIAYHVSTPPGPCEDGKPCVRFVSSRRLPDGKRWKVSLKNVVTVLRHEEIHHVLDKIGEDPGNGFDALHKDYSDVCWILNCTNHQVTS